MGRPKQLLDWNGQSFLRHACQTALATVCRPIVVVLGDKAEMCSRELNNLDVASVTNVDWRQGMGTSVSAGIRALEKLCPDAPGALLMLVDQPTVDAAFLNQLLSLWSPPGHPIAATTYPERGGVPAIFDRSYFSELRELNADQGASGLINRDLKQVIRVKPPAPFLDFDTPEMYETTMLNKHSA